MKAWSKKIIMRKIELCYVITVALLVINCSNDESSLIIEDCPESIFIGEYFFKQNTIDNPPYKDENEILVFSDSLGVEYKGVLTIGQVVNRMNYSSIYECESDPDSIYYWKYSHLNDTRKTLLEFSGIDISIEFYNYINPLVKNATIEAPLGTNIETTDKLLIGLNPFSPDYEKLNRIVVNVCDLYNPDAVFYNGTVFYDSLKIHDKSFDSVYCFKNFLEDEAEYDFDLYYTREKGLVGFKNLTNSVSLKLERSE